MITPADTEFTAFARHVAVWLPLLVPLAVGSILAVVWGMWR